MRRLARRHYGAGRGMVPPCNVAFDFAIASPLELAAWYQRSSPGTLPTSGTFAINVSIGDLEYQRLKNRRLRAVDS